MCAIYICYIFNSSITGGYWIIYSDFHCDEITTNNVPVFPFPHFTNICCLLVNNHPNG